MSVKTTAEQAADLYATRLGNATERIRLGVENVSVSPMEKAAKSKDKLIANFTKAVNDGKWERGLRRVTLEDWKNAFLTKGIDRIASGAMAAKPKMVAFYTKLFPFQNTLLSKVEGMPNVTLDQAIARSNAWIRGMAAFKME